VLPGFPLIKTGREVAYCTDAELTGGFTQQVEERQQVTSSRHFNGYSIIDSSWGSGCMGVAPLKYFRCFPPVYFKQREWDTFESNCIPHQIHAVPISLKV